MLSLISNAELFLHIKAWLQWEEFFLVSDYFTEEICKSSSNGQRKRCVKQTRDVRL